MAAALLQGEAEQQSVRLASLAAAAVVLATLAPARWVELEAQRQAAPDLVQVHPEAEVEILDAAAALRPSAVGLVRMAGERIPSARWIPHRLALGTRPKVAASLESRQASLWNDAPGRKPERARAWASPAARSAGWARFRS